MTCRGLNHEPPLSNDCGLQPRSSSGRRVQWRCAALVGSDEGGLEVGPLTTAIVRVGGDMAAGGELPNRPPLAARDAKSVDDVRVLPVRVGVAVGAGPVLAGHVKLVVLPVAGSADREELYVDDDIYQRGEARVRGLAEIRRRGVPSDAIEAIPVPAAMAASGAATAKDVGGPWHVVSEACGGGAVHRVVAAVTVEAWAAAAFHHELACLLATGPTVTPKQPQSNRELQESQAACYKRPRVQANITTDYRKEREREGCGGGGSLKEKGTAANRSSRRDAQKDESQPLSASLIVVTAATGTKYAIPSRNTHPIPT